MLLNQKITLQGEVLFRRRGTYLSLIAVPILIIAFYQYRHPFGGDPAGLIWTITCLAVSLTGLSLRIFTAGCRPRRTSGRNKKKGQVADALNTSGAYSLTRNPLYLANFIVILGVVMYFFLWWLVVMYALAFWLYYERIIMAEENFLKNKFGDEYIQWAETTPVFFPAFRNWRPPVLPFSWKTALKAEYQTLSLTVVVFIALEVVSHFRTGQNFLAEPAWIGLMAVTLIFFTTVRYIHKRTRFLRVPGR
ncbi:MAG: isoprenylcysteine carboxylmethyltransferase family protein [Thermodesulfobacteriota bacterium]